MPDRYHWLRHKTESDGTTYSDGVTPHPKTHLFRTFKEVVNFLLANDGREWTYEYD